MTSTFTRIRRVRSYKDAEAFYENTKPIRGRGNQHRPLGARKDIDRFYMVKSYNALTPDNTPDGPPPIYQCFLYRTPLVTFHPDGRVVLDIGTDYKPSISDAYFFYYLLGQRAQMRDRAVVVHFGGKKVAFNTQHHSAVLHHDEYGQLVPEERVIMGYKINRKEANNVRREYAAFYRWVKAAVSLRQDDGHIRITAREMMEVVPTQEVESNGVQTVEFLGVTDAHQLPSFKSSDDEIKQIKIRQCKRIVELAGSSDETDYYKALLFIVFQHGRHAWFYTTWDKTRVRRIELDTFKFSILASSIPKAIDHLLFSHHANKVLQMLPLEDGQLPNKLYEQWASGWDGYFRSV